MAFIVRVVPFIYVASYLFSGSFFFFKNDANTPPSFKKTFETEKLNFFSLEKMQPFCCFVHRARDSGGNGARRRKPSQTPLPTIKQIYTHFIKTTPLISHTPFKISKRFSKKVHLSKSKNIFFHNNKKQQNVVWIKINDAYLSSGGGGVKNLILAIFLGVK